MERIEDLCVNLDELTVTPVITGSYNDLTDKPKINSVELSGNKTLQQLGIQRKLTAGNNITIDENGVISAQGGVSEVGFEDIIGEPHDNEALGEELDEIRSIAEGASASIVINAEDNEAFASTETDIEVEDVDIVDINGVHFSTEDLKLGQTIWVMESEYPDRWITTIEDNSISARALSGQAEVPVADVKVDGVSVVDANKVAQITMPRQHKSFVASYADGILNIHTTSAGVLPTQTFTTTDNVVHHFSELSVGDTLALLNAPNTMFVCKMVVTGQVYLEVVCGTEQNYQATSSRAQSGKAVAQAVAGKADASTVYTKTEMDTALGAKANAADVYDKDDVDEMLSTKVSDVTVNGTSVVEDGVAAVEVPVALSELTDDATHRLVTDAEKASWSAKADVSDIPTTLAELSGDATHRVVTDAEKASWDAKGDGIIPEVW